MKNLFLTFFTVVMVLAGVSGCTRAVLKVAGVDPDEIVLRDADTNSMFSYDATIDKINSLKTPLKNHGIVVIPSEDRVREFLEKSGYIERATIAYRNEVYDAIGSKRSLSEIRPLIAPAAVHNVYADFSVGFVEALKKRGLFRSIEIVKTSEYPESMFAGSGTTLIADYSDNQSLILHVVSDGYKTSVAGSEAFKGGGTGANLKFDRFLRWVETTIRKSAAAAKSEKTEFVSSSNPVRIKGVAATPSTNNLGETTFPSFSLDIQYQKEKINSNDIAVIIGNADYKKLGKDIPNVTPAYADAEGMKRYVTQALGVRDENIIFLKDATQARMTSTFGSKDNPRGQLFNYVKAGKSRVFVYYSGHGAPGGKDGDSYIVPTNAEASLIELNGYPLKTLYKNLGQIPAKSITVVLEACFSGVSQGGTVISNASPVYLKAKETNVPANITVIAAGAANQIASWEQDSSSGLFTKYFLKGMSGEADAKPYGNGDGKVGYDELGRYFKETLTYYARRYYGREQTPQIVVGSGS